MTKALKNLLLVLLALCMSVCIGLFAVACNSGDDKEPNHKTDQDGEDEGEGEEEGDGEEEEEVGETYTITLEIGEGTLPAGASTTCTTGTNGKLSTIPTPVAPTENWGLLGWYLEDETEVKSSTVFTADTTIYAKYGRLDGVWNKDGSEYIVGLTRNTGETAGIQYWISNDDSITLDEGDEISLYMNGELVTFNVHADNASSCIENADNTSTKVTYVTVSEEATFKIYLWDYSNGGEANWSCQFLGTATSIPTTSTIPDGCEEIKITGTNGTATIYLVVNGVAVNSSNGANYQIHGWQTGNVNVFGEWNDNPTLAAEVEVDCDLLDDLILQFHWGDSKSGNVSHVKVDGTYIIKINTLSGSTVSVKEYDENGPEDTDEDDVPQLVVGGYYLAGDFNSWSLDVNYYIDATKGITLELAAGVGFQAIICTSADGGKEWSCPASGSYYHMAASAGDGYFAAGSSNLIVLVAGTYTFTVDNSGATPVFTIAPEDGLTGYTMHYYIKGQIVTNGWGEPTTNEYEMVKNGSIYTLEIGMKAGDEFMFWAQQEDSDHNVTRSEAMIQAGKLVANDYVVAKGTNLTTNAEGTYTFTFNSETSELTVSFVAAATDAE